MAEHTEETFSLQRILLLERENYDLKQKLESISQQKDELWAKYDAVSEDYMRLEHFVHRVGRKMTEQISVKKLTVQKDILSPRVMPLIDNETHKIVAQFPTTRTANAVDEKIADGVPNEAKEMPGPSNGEIKDGTLAPVDTRLESGSTAPDLEEKTVPDLEEKTVPDLVKPHEEKPGPSRMHFGGNRKKAETCFYFDNLNLKENLLHAIRAYGQEKLYVHEASCIIPTLLTGHDVVVEDQCENHGMGRIAMYSIFILQLLDVSDTNCQALILVPYRNLAQKILSVVQALGNKMGIQSHACIGGGTKIKQEKTTLSNGVQLIVGTPGRVYDMILRKSLKTESISFLVMDEAQKLLSDIFVDQTRKVFQRLPTEKRMSLFTTEMTEELENFCQEFMKDRRTYQIQAIVPKIDSTNHFNVKLDRSDMKAKTLMDVQAHFPDSRTVIYCNAQKKVGFLKQLLLNKKERILFVHSGMKPELRERILTQFSSGSIRTLITTDMPLRSLHEGFELSNVSLLINYELPTTPEQYLSRISLCGSLLAKDGIVVNFVIPKCEAQLQAIQKIQDFYKLDMVEIAEGDAEPSNCSIC